MEWGILNKKPKRLLEAEIEKGMGVLWVDIDEAIRLIYTNKSVSQYATPLQVKYTQVRDITFLEELKKSIT